MDFEAYYSATEEAFAQEKEEMLYKVDKLRDNWTKVAELDQLLIDRNKEMLNLKKMISKGHLQILRTKEECLHMQLKNSQLRFHVRQLQSEIFRLLPFSHTEVPSTEYHMSLDRKVYQATPHANKSEADLEHKADLKVLHKKWTDLCDQQLKVFAEETLHYEEDKEQWNKFKAAIESQNRSTHKLIDTQLSDVTSRYVALKSANDDLVSSGQETCDSLAKKLDRLKSKLETTLTSLANRRTIDAKDAQVQASKMTKELRRRVRNLEIKNQNIIDELQEDHDALQDEHDDLLDDIDDINAKLRVLQENNEVLHSEGDSKISSLEAELNALISAAAAVKEGFLEQDLNVISTVAAAVGNHGNSALDVERTHQQIQSLGRRLEAVSQHCE